jgi:hypothetical protein
MTSQQPAARFPTGSHDSLANWLALLALLALGIVWPFADAATPPAGHGGSLLVKAR